MVRTMFTKLTAGAVMSLAVFAWTSQADAFGHHRGWGGGSSGGYGGGYGGSRRLGRFERRMGWFQRRMGWFQRRLWRRLFRRWLRRWLGPSWWLALGRLVGRIWWWLGRLQRWLEWRLRWLVGRLWRLQRRLRWLVGRLLWRLVGRLWWRQLLLCSCACPRWLIRRWRRRLSFQGRLFPRLPLPVAPAPGSNTSTMRADGLLAVNVPEDAKIYVNGQATSSIGENRQYVSRDLQNGYNYTYEVRAEVVRDGRTVEQVKKIDVRAGETARVAFDFPAGDSAETSLTLHVPADAKVFLAGNPTKANGETRVFRTDRLISGKTWQDYTIRVELDRGGRTVTKEETITLNAGQSQELRFDFDGDKIASAR